MEKALRDLKKSGHGCTGREISSKTLRNYSECLKSFCSWAKKREYLEKDPLENLATVNGSPTSTRRALTADEVSRLLEVAPEQRKLLYEVALMTGLRAGELRSLSLNDIDLKNSQLVLHAEWTKNRKAGLQPIPEDLAIRLLEYGKKKVARWLYDNRYSRKDAAEVGIPENPLLFVSTHPSRELDKDLLEAEIEKYIPDDGKIDFHSLRHCFVTRLFEAGANPKQARVLARHSDVRLTMNTYARAQSNDLKAIVDRMLPILQQKKCAKYVHKSEEEGDGGDSISISSNPLDHFNNGGGGGIRNRCTATI